MDFRNNVDGLLLIVCIQDNEPVHVIWPFYLPVTAKKELHHIQEVTTDFTVCQRNTSHKIPMRFTFTHRPGRDTCIFKQGLIFFIIEDCEISYIEIM